MSLISCTLKGYLYNILLFCFCVFAHFSKFSMYAWGKKRKMLVFTGVYVCVKAKLTLVSFFSIFFFPPFPHLNSLFPFSQISATMSIVQSQHNNQARFTSTDITNRGLLLQGDFLFTAVFWIFFRIFWSFFIFVQNLPTTQHDAVAPRDLGEAGYWIVLSMLEVPFVLKRQLLSSNFMHSPENERLKFKMESLQ